MGGLLVPLGFPLKNQSTEGSLKKDAHAGVDQYAIYGPQMTMGHLGGSPHGHPV